MLDAGSCESVEDYVSPSLQGGMAAEMLDKSKGTCTGALAGVISQKQFHFMVAVAAQRVADKSASSGRDEALTSAVGY